MAGGISNCADWQSEMASKLENVNLTIINPRRDYFDLSDENAGSEQIEWEAVHLRLADIISFWFSPETVCPITLLELGLYCKSDTTVLVGCDPNYVRKFDVVKQLSIYEPNILVCFSLDELVNQIKTKLKLSAHEIKPLVNNELKVGDVVTRYMPGNVTMPVTITAIKDDLIECQLWQFDRNTGQEIDDMFPDITVSYINLEVK